MNNSDHPPIDPVETDHRVRVGELAVKQAEMEIKRDETQIKRDETQIKRDELSIKEDEAEDRTLGRAISFLTCFVPAYGDRPIRLVETFGRDDRPSSDDVPGTIAVAVQDALLAAAEYADLSFRARADDLRGRRAPRPFHEDHPGA